MAKVTEVALTYSKSIQPKPNAPWIKLSLSATATLDDEDTRKEVTASLYKDLKRQLHTLMAQDIKDHS